jgi:hypothetical protein
MALGLTVSLSSDFAALPGGDTHSPYYASPFQDVGTYGARASMIASSLDFFYSYLFGQNYQLLQAIKNGAGFFFSDNDYLKHPNVEVKRETPCSETMSSEAVKESSLIEPSSSSSLVMLSAAAPTRKRLHRSAAATVKSYAYAQSDSDDGFPSHGTTSDSFQPTRTVESDLQLWIRHLSALQKDETKKVFFMCLPL